MEMAYVIYPKQQQPQQTRPPTDDTTTTDSGNGHGANADSTIQNQPADANATKIPDSTDLDSGNLQGTQQITMYCPLLS